VGGEKSSSQQKNWKIEGEPSKRTGGRIPAEKVRALVEVTSHQIKSPEENIRKKKKPCFEEKKEIRQWDPKGCLWKWKWEKKRLRNRAKTGEWKKTHGVAEKWKGNWEIWLATEKEGVAVIRGKPGKISFGGITLVTKQQLVKKKTNPCCGWKQVRRTSKRHKTTDHTLLGKKLKNLTGEGGDFSDGEQVEDQMEKKSFQEKPGTWEKQKRNGGRDTENLFGFKRRFWDKGEAPESGNKSV